MAGERRALEDLARLWGVQPGYVDVLGQRRRASTHALLRVLAELGAPVASSKDAGAAVRQRWLEQWRQVLEPVSVAWQGRPTSVAMRLPEVTSSRRNARYHLRMVLEEGANYQQDGALGDLAELERASIEGQAFVRLAVPIERGLPDGYHRVELEVGGRSHETLLFAAPPRAWLPDSGRSWGVFLPTYALRTARRQGVGDLADLEALWQWVESLGGSVIATLPLCAAFLDRPFEPSPYAPVSRQFWNELYLALDRLPELGACAAARRVAATAEYVGEMESLDRAPLVDYRRQMATKRRILEELAACAFADPSSPLRSVLAQSPELADYARFRAEVERRGQGWHGWPSPSRDGDLGDAGDDARYRYHAYVQWRMDGQLRELGDRMRAAGPGLYLDFALGVHPDGYDAWRHRDCFLTESSAGAPPDAFHTRGQDWGFRPLHPQGIRRDGYSYLRRCLGRHMSVAGIVRIDHVMGLHRLFCVPRGMEAREGLYLRYCAEELYALLCIESQRHRALLVGEDLGTVPREVRRAMGRRGVQRFYVLQYELRADEQSPLGTVPRQAAAAMNTHDMPPFAAFFHGKDIDERLASGHLDRESARRERAERAAALDATASHFRRRGLLRGQDGTMAFLAAALDVLGSSQARMVLVNLEDLWLDPEPQNRPGKQSDGNWRRRSGLALEQFRDLPDVVNTLHRINRARRRVE